MKDSHLWTQWKSLEAKEQSTSTFNDDAGRRRRRDDLVCEEGKTRRDATSKARRRTTAQGETVCDGTRQGDRRQCEERQRSTMTIRGTTCVGHSSSLFPTYSLGCGLMSLTKSTGFASESTEFTTKTSLLSSQLCKG